MKLLDKLDVPINLIENIENIKCAIFQYDYINDSDPILLKQGFNLGDLLNFIKYVNSNTFSENARAMVFNIWLKDGSCFQLYYNWDGWKDYRWHHHKLPPIPSELLPKIDLSYLVKKE